MVCAPNTHFEGEQMRQQGCSICATDVCLAGRCISCHMLGSPAGAALPLLCAVHMLPVCRLRCKTGSNQALYCDLDRTYLSYEDCCIVLTCGPRLRSTGRMHA